MRKCEKVVFTNAIAISICPFRTGTNTICCMYPSSNVRCVFVCALVRVRSTANFSFPRTGSEHATCLLPPLTGSTTVRRGLRLTMVFRRLAYVTRDTCIPSNVEGQAPLASDGGRLPSLSPDGRITRVSRRNRSVQRQILSFANGVSSPSSAACQESRRGAPWHAALAGG